MSMFSTHTRSAKSATLLLVIEGAHIHCVLTSTLSDGRPCILWRTKHAVSHRQPKNTDAYLHRLRETIDIAVCAATTAPAIEQREAYVADIHCIVCAPWSVGDVVSVEETFDARRTVLKTDIEALRQSASVPDEENGANYSELERSILTTWLNDYTVSEPVGKQAQNMRVDVYVSKLCDPVRNYLEKTIETHWGGREITFHSDIAVIAQTNTTLMRQAEPHFIVKVGDEATELVYVRAGNVVGSRRIHNGVDHMVHVLGTALNMRPEAAYDMFTRFIDDTITHAREEDVQNAIDPIREEWRSSVVGEMKALCEEDLPRSFYVVSDSTVRAWYTNILSEVDDERALTPVEITPASLVSRCRGGGSADVILTLGACYVSDYHHDQIAGVK